MTDQTTMGGQPAAKLSSGQAMPMVGLGTWLSSNEDAKLAVAEALRVGYRHIDCAATYKNEEGVGEAFQEAFSGDSLRREDVFVTSKLWLTDTAPQDVAPALTKTLSDLKLEYLDLYLVHFPYFLRKGAGFPPAEEDRLGYTHEQFLATWRELEKEVDAGRVKNIGVSNMSATKLARLLADARIKPAANQVEIHPYLQQNELVKFCQANNVVVTAYSPLGNPGRPELFREAGHLAPLEDGDVQAIARKHNATPGQVLIRFAVERGITVIPKSVKPARIAENFGALNIRLDDEDMAKLRALDRHMRFLKGDIFVPRGGHWQELWDEEVPAEARSA